LPVGPQATVDSVSPSRWFVEFGGMDGFGGFNWQFRLAFVIGISADD